MGNKGAECAESSEGEGKEMPSNSCHYIILLYRGLSEWNAVQFILGGIAPP